MTCQIQIYTKSYSYPHLTINSTKTFEECKTEGIALLKEYPGLMCIILYMEGATKSKRITLYRLSDNDGFFGLDPRVRKELDKCLLQ